MKQKALKRSILPSSGFQMTFKKTSLAISSVECQARRTEHPCDAQQHKGRPPIISPLLVVTEDRGYAYIGHEGSLGAGGESVGVGVGVQCPA
eukprot:1151711-Pelagomonas_calceolata.AAC.2